MSNNAPSPRFVEVPAATFEAFLKEAFAKASFTRETFRNEVVYVVQHHRCQHTFIKVYTSIAEGRTDARGCGEDAIRVLAIFSKPATDRSRAFTKVITKETRVHRTAPVGLPIEERVKTILGRVLERARSAYEAANEFHKTEGCWTCGTAQKARDNAQRAACTAPKGDKS